MGFAGSAARHYELGPIGLALVKRTVPVDATLLAGGVAAAQEVIVPPDAGANVKVTLRRPARSVVSNSPRTGRLARRAAQGAAAGVSQPPVRQIVTTAPQTRAHRGPYVAGETAEDAVAVTRALRAAGLLVTLDYLGEDTTEPASRPRPSRASTSSCSASWPPRD